MSRRQAKGNRRYRCLECGMTRMVRACEHDRASRVRCASCGSLAMEPDSSEAKKQLATFTEQRQVGLGGSVLNEGGHRGGRIKGSCA